MTSFHRFKLGFDCTFWIDEIADKSQETIYQVAVESQAAALSVLRPGVKAEEVHTAYAEVIQSSGYETIGDGVPECEVALAISACGTRRSGGTAK